MTDRLPAIKRKGRIGARQNNGDLAGTEFRSVILESLGKLIRTSRPPNEELTRPAANRIRYSEDNAGRMRCPVFRVRGPFVGSGTVGAGFKTVTGARPKRAVKFRTASGAHAIVALRCHRLGGKFEDYREHRATIA